MNFFNFGSLNLDYVYHVPHFARSVFLLPDDEGAPDQKMSDRN